MKNDIVWQTAGGEQLTKNELGKVSDEYLLNICRHIVLRVELALTTLDFFASPYAPVGRIADIDKKGVCKYHELEVVALEDTLSSLRKEAFKRGLEQIYTKVHKNSWI